MIRKIVCGCPCSGKTTFVKESASPGALIWDYDMIHVALSGLGFHEHLRAIRPFVLAARESVFDLLEKSNDIPAWVITSGRRFSDIAELCKRFKAELVFLNIDRQEAHRRATDSGRPDDWHLYIDNWFNESDIIENIERIQKMNDQIRKKTFNAPIVLDPESTQGEFEAVFATLEVKDKDGDTTRAGAFIEGQETLIEAWNHNYQQLPVGKGAIFEIGNEAVFKGRFFLDTMAGLEHYKTVKNIGNIQEWSYTFEIIDDEWETNNGVKDHFLTGLDVWGVSPVQRGAGIETRTVVIKAKTEETQAVESDETEETQAVESDETQADFQGEDGQTIKPREIKPGVVLAQIDLIELEI